MTKRKTRHRMGNLKMQVLGLKPELYTVEEVANMFRTSKQVIYNMSAEYGLAFKRAPYTRTK